VGLTAVAGWTALLGVVLGGAGGARTALLGVVTGGRGVCREMEGGWRGKEGVGLETSLLLR